MTEGKILVVDDEYFIRSTMQLFLETEGFYVAAADSGTAALQCLDQESFDVAIVDIRMAGMTGLELLRRMRERRDDVEVIIATGYSSGEAIEEATRLGAFDFITKPITDFEQTMLKVVRRAVERKRLYMTNRRLAAEVRLARRRAREAQEDLDRTSGELDALHEFGLLLHHQRDLESLLDVTAEAMASALQVEAGLVLVRDGNSTFRAVRGIGVHPEPLQDFVLGDDPKGLMDAVLSGEPRILPPVNDVPQFRKLTSNDSHDHHDDVHGEGEQGGSTAVVPLVSQSEILGVIIAWCLRDREVERMRSLSILSSQLSGAVSACLREVS